MDLLDDESLLDLRRRARPTDAAAVLEEERRLRQTRRAAASGFLPPAAPPADPTVCALCKVGKPRDACLQCGRPACAADLWIMLRLCRDCATDQDVERGQRDARPSAKNWLEGRT